MNFDLSEAEGEYLVRLARRAITSYLAEGEVLQEEPQYPSLKERAGAFVTLKRYPSGDLRGCIGFPEPIYPLYVAVIRAAIASATEDPRFFPVKLSELPNLTVEVSVLSPPEPIQVGDRESIPKEVVVGRDGLIIRRGPWSGLLLPQVPVELGWDSEEFLDQTCLKAGLPPGCWKWPEVEIYRFTAIVFSEARPLGPVRRVPLTERT
ncbi:MAG TPA: TIGR00296 family protein [Candidatus Korarchaeota archaeon]|nr:TIGR00296 family protein [Candidatus Korarchaeota archaeon]